MTKSKLDLLEFLSYYCCNDGLSKVSTEPETKIPLSVLHDIIGDGSGDVLISLLSSLVTNPDSELYFDSYPNLSTVTDTSSKVNSTELFTNCIQVISLIIQSDLKSANTLLESLDYKTVMWGIITFLTAYYQDTNK